VGQSILRETLGQRARVGAK